MTTWRIRHERQKDDLGVFRSGSIRAADFAAEAALFEAQLKNLPNGTRVLVINESETLSPTYLFTVRRSGVTVEPA